MSEEMQLVVLGGVIAFISTILGTLLAFALTYWTEERREKRRVKLDLKKATTRYMAIVAQSKYLRGEDILSNPESYNEAFEKLDIEKFSSIEDLVAVLGLVEELTNIALWGTELARRNAEEKLKQSMNQKTKEKQSSKMD